MKNRNFFREWQQPMLSLLVIAILLIAVSANATVITWTNAAGGNWSNPLNWSPNQVPGQLNDSNNTDDVVITGNTSFDFFTITFDEGDATNFWGVHNVTIGGDNNVETLSIANGTTLRAAKVDVLGFNGFYGELFCQSSAISASVNVNSGGRLVSSGSDPAFYGAVELGGNATISGTTFYSSLTVSNSGTVTLTADSAVIGPTIVAGKFNLQSGSLYIEGPLTNSGTIAFLDSISYGGDAIYILNDGSTNFEGGVVNLAGGIFKLKNAYNKGIKGLYGNEYFLNHGVITCTNGGSINVAVFDNSSGAITNWTGILSLGQFTNAFAGTFYSPTSSSIWLNGGTAASPLAPGPSLAINGPGGYRFMSGFLLLTNNLIPNLTLSSGNLELGPNFQGGTITNLTFDSMWLTNSTLPVTGTMTVDGSTAQVFGGLNIAADGTLNANSGYYHGPLNVASNGIVTMINATLDSDASMAINGTLNIFSNPYVNGPITNFNTMNLLGRVYINNDGANYWGSIVNQSGGVINILTNGTIQTTGGNKEYLINDGTMIRIGDTNNSIINLSNVTNSGSIIIQQGALQFSHLALLPSGSLNVRLNSKTDYGKAIISSQAILNGSFGVMTATNYWPSAGDSFRPLAYGSYTGSFTVTNLPATIPMLLTYTPTNLTLQVAISQPIITSTLSSGNQIIFSGTNGLPKNTYWILATTNLALPFTNWMIISTNQFDVNGNFAYTNSVASTNCQEFFIIQTQ